MRQPTHSNGAQKTIDRCSASAKSLVRPDRARRKSRIRKPTSHVSVYGSSSTVATPQHWPSGKVTTGRRALCRLRGCDDPHAVEGAGAALAGGPAAGRHHARGATRGCVGSRRGRSPPPAGRDFRGPRSRGRSARGDTPRAGRAPGKTCAPPSLGGEPARRTALVHRTGSPRATATASPWRRATRAGADGARAGGRLHRVTR